MSEDDESTNISAPGGLTEADEEPTETEYENNALRELLNHVAKVGSNLRAANLRITRGYYVMVRTLVLPKNHTRKQCADFFKYLDFPKVKDFGLARDTTAEEPQIWEYEEFLVRGVVWFDDGSWSTRANYDCGYFWLHHKRPASPDLHGKE